MLYRIELILLEDDVDDFFYDHAEKILIEEKSIKDILDEGDSTDLTEGELKPYIKKFKGIFDYLITLIEKTSNDGNYTIPNNFDDFAKDKGIKVDEHKDWYDLVYRTIWDSVPEDTSSNLPWGFKFKPLLPTSLLMKTVNRVPMQVQMDRIKERNKLEDDVQILTGMKKEQEKILTDYGKVSGLWGGLAVLIYACIVGIAIPSTLLPYPLETYNDVATKQLLLSLFFSELIALFIYLGVSMSVFVKIVVVKPLKHISIKQSNFHLIWICQYVLD